MGRILFSTTAGEGHFRPLIPLARAFVAEGDEVAFATAESFADRVESAGFTLLPAGIGGDELEARFAPARVELAKLPLHERRPYAFTWRFTRIDAPSKVAALRAAVSAWDPDLIVHESADLAAPLVATSLGVPRVHHSFGRMVPLVCFELAASETEPLWRADGLEPQPFGGVFEGPYVDISPPSLQTQGPPAGTRSELLRPVSALRSIPSDPPKVYVTLGTIFNDLAIFRLLLDALADVDCQVIATVGTDNDPVVLDPLPANAVVQRFIPQAEILPGCSATVGHGGSGSALAALAHGVPMLLLPRGADQFDNAGACEQAGVARVLMPDAVTAEAVREAVVALLTDPSYRVRAEALADEIGSMPVPEAVVDRLRSS